MKNVTRVVYVTNARLPTEKAHGLATIKLCEAFADLGVDLEIVAPRLWRDDDTDVFQFYQVKQNFKVCKIPTLDVGFLIQMFSFSMSAFIYLFLKYYKQRKEIIFFSHDYIPLYFLTFIFRNTYYDIHHFPGKNFMYRRLMRLAFGFSVQTRWKIEALNKEWDIPAEKVVYWPNGTDVEKFQIKARQSEARIWLGLPLEKKIVLYTGQLFDWKGADTLMRAIPRLSRRAEIYFVGGTPSDVNLLKRSCPEANLSNVHFISFRPHQEMPYWMRAADVLVIPNTAKMKVSLYYTSPMKLFEYMASGTPMVASDIPSIREIISEDSACLAIPDDPKSFAEKIQFVLDNPDLADEKAKRALKVGEIYTWQNRADKILEHMHLTIKIRLNSITREH